MWEESKNTTDKRIERIAKNKSIAPGDYNTEKAWKTT